MFAGHLPKVWDQKSPDIDAVADEVKQFLAGKGVTAVSVIVPVVQVRHGGDGVERVVALVQLANSDLMKAQVALNQFKATGSRDARRLLSYMNVRSLQRQRRHRRGVRAAARKRTWISPPSTPTRGRWPTPTTT
jgi:hypothetical protein